MDSLLLALIGCLLGEMGGRGQWLVLALANRYERDGTIIAGIIVAAIANAALSALAGAWIGPMLGPYARLLFLALAMAFLGAGLLWPMRRPDPLTGWRIGPFLTSALGLLILSFGEGSQFLILGIAARMNPPVLAAIGGMIGVAAAMIPVVALRDRFFTVMPLRAIRWTGGALLLLAAAIMALKAVGLIA